MSIPTYMGYFWDLYSVHRSTLIHKNKMQFWKTLLCVRYVRLHNAGLALKGMRLAPPAK